MRSLFIYLYFYRSIYTLVKWSNIINVIFNIIDPNRWIICNSLFSMLSFMTRETASKYRFFFLLCFSKKNVQLFFLFFVGFLFSKNWRWNSSLEHQNMEHILEPHIVYLYQIRNSTKWEFTSMEHNGTGT